MPFTVQDFFGVFTAYNDGVWPMQLVLAAAALAATFLASRKAPAASRTVSWLLGGLWIWMAAAYHVVYFSRVNPAAYLFAALFALQGLLFVWEGGVHDRLRFRTRADLPGAVGAILVTYALLIYPLIGLLLGRSYPAAPTFGLPCPTTIFTLGVLLWADRRVPIRLIVVPLLWTLVGTSVVFSFAMFEDAALPLAGLLSLVLLARRNRRRIPAEVEVAM